mgnify:FL=1
MLPFCFEDLLCSLVWEMAQIPAYQMIPCWFKGKDVAPFPKSDSVV